jgi:hypothetical protein
MVLITIVTGAYKPTYNLGPHIVGIHRFLYCCVVDDLNVGLGLPWPPEHVRSAMNFRFQGMWEDPSN